MKATVKRRLFLIAMTLGTVMLYVEPALAGRRGP